MISPSTTAAKQASPHAPRDARILVVSPLYPPAVGGLMSHAAEWNIHMAEAGHTIIVFTPLVTPNAPLDEKTHEGVHIIRFPAWQIIPNYPIPKFWLPSFWKQWRLVHKFLQPTTNNQQPPIVVSRTRFFATSLMTLLVSKRYRSPWLHIEHGSDYVHLNNPVFSALAHLYDETLGRLVLRTADAVVANSSASAAFVRRLCGREAHVIYRGIEKDRIAEVPPADLSKILSSITAAAGPRQRAGATCVINYTGRLIDGKGLPDLLQAFKNMISQMSVVNCQLLIVGSGPQRRRLEELTKQLGLADHVIFLGEQPFERTIAILKASDIFVNPSYTEGLPTSVIEAALCRVPVIATTVGGTTEIIQHDFSGALIPADRPQELANTLIQLLDDPQRRAQLAQNAYVSISNLFSWDETIKRYSEVLCAVLSAK